MIGIKRVYDSSSPEDGKRFLVDRLWPRGVNKEKAQLDGWFKNVAPSNELRSWFGHDSKRWGEFKKRYFAELDTNAEEWKALLTIARKENITLVYGAKDTEHNNATALMQFLKAKMQS
jgi:uncharacterized protein YeaO (DUF488 family)